MIDAHFHIWQLDRGDYGWLTPALAPIYRDVSLDDWRRVSRPCGVTAGILVQAAPTEAETRFLLAQARWAPEVAAVVGWLDLRAVDAAQRIAALAYGSKLRGLRPMLHDLDDPDWILHDDLQPALEAMVALDLALDVLVKPVHLPRIQRLAARFPRLRIVVDHGAKPNIAVRQWSDWARGLEQLSAAPQVYCKLSGLWTEAGTGVDVDAVAVYAQHVLACFGTEKVLWGSDWPVLELAGSYLHWHAAAARWVAPRCHAAVFDAVARRVYRIVDVA